MGVIEADPALAQADIHLIQRLIPHRYPFLYIDRVIDMVPSESATGIKNVTVNEPFFPGHFPSKPVLPGVIIVEAMAQTASALVSWSMDLTDTELLVYFMGIDKARFRRIVEPGDTLALKVQVIRKGAKVWKFGGIAAVGEDIAAEAEFMAMIQRPEADSKGETGGH